MTRKLPNWSLILSFVRLWFVEMINCMHFSLNNSHSLNILTHSVQNIPNDLILLLIYPMFHFLDSMICGLLELIVWKITITNKFWWTESKKQLSWWIQIWRKNFEVRTRNKKNAHRTRNMHVLVSEIKLEWDWVLTSTYSSSQWKNYVNDFRLFINGSDSNTDIVLHKHFKIRSHIQICQMDIYFGVTDYERK